MGKCSKGIEWVLLPSEEPSVAGQMGSSKRRRQAILFYRLILVGSVIGLIVLGISWYGITKRPNRKTLHDQIQNQLTINTNQQWMDNYKEGKNDEWQWEEDEEDDLPPGNLDYFRNNDEEEQIRKGTVGVTGAHGSAEEDEDQENDEYDNYAAFDYRDHFPGDENHGPWSMSNTVEVDLENLHQVIPSKDFRINYKNPCWTEPMDLHDPYKENFYVKERPVLKSYFGKLFEKLGNRNLRLRCLPYFYIFDGPEAEFEEKDNFYKLFQSHPYIARPPVHRPQFWNKRRLENGTKFRDYIDLFDQAASEIRADVIKMDTADIKIAHAKIVGDDSGSYLWDFDSWKKLSLNDALLEEPTYIAADYIARQTPDSMFIIILRNPLKRLAEYYYKVLKPGASEQEFHQDVLQSITLFRQCLGRHEYVHRKCVYDKELNLKMKVPLRIALYSLFLPDWFLRFEKTQFKFIVYEEFRRLPVNTLNSAYKFLGLSHLPPGPFNDVKKHWWTAMENRTLIWPMLNSTRKMLKDFFSPYNQALSEIIEKPELTEIWDTATDQSELKIKKKQFIKIEIQKLMAKMNRTRPSRVASIVATNPVQVTTRVPLYPTKEPFKQQVQQAVAKNLSPQSAYPSQQMGQVPLQNGLLAPNRQKQWQLPRKIETGRIPTDNKNNYNEPQVLKNAPIRNNPVQEPSQNNLNNIQQQNSNQQPKPFDNPFRPTDLVKLQGKPNNLAGNRVPESAQKEYPKPPNTAYNPVPNKEVKWGNPVQLGQTNPTKQEQGPPVNRFDQARGNVDVPVDKQRATVKRY